MPEQNIDTISFGPVKSFFVHMLTRDILLKDAILDLLDNCVDGIQRCESKSALEKKRPYEGYWAKITFSRGEFQIEDNCGGIPWKYHEYAFQMGRGSNNHMNDGLKSVGVYGIGMKRAIFKIGQDCIIETHAKDKSYKVHISSAWLKDDQEWKIRPEFIKAKKEYGTNIKIGKILPSIAKSFESEPFYLDFCSTIATHFAFIMDKGFEIRVNGKVISPKSLKLLFGDLKESKSNIQPFIYKAKIKDVDVFLTVGFTRPIPSIEEAEEGYENFKERYSPADAGWSIICNDRTILQCDKTALTGWGVSGVPQFHNQFISISGMVIFTSTEPEQLPTTTTKRGIDASSELFLHIRDKMIEGMKIFIQYTNEWKSKELIVESRRRFEKTTSMDVGEMKQMSSKLPMNSTQGIYAGRQFKPNLPRPEKKKTNERISFVRPLTEVKKVSTHLFKSPNRNPSQVGDKCFELILEETSE